MLSNNKCLEYAKKITPSLNICGVSWKLNKIKPQADVYGLCDHKHKIIHYSDNQTLVHEYVHAWLYHNDNENCGDEYAVMRITNMILNNNMYGGNMKKFKFETSSEAQYDPNGVMLTEEIGVAFECTEQVTFEQEMLGEIPWVEVGEMTRSEFEKWSSGEEEILSTDA